jgi:hypothetical protein
VIDQLQLPHPLDLVDRVQHPGMMHGTKVTADFRSWTPPHRLAYFLLFQASHPDEVLGAVF